MQRLRDERRARLQRQHHAHVRHQHGQVLRHQEPPQDEAVLQEDGRLQDRTRLACLHPCVQLYHSTR